MDGREEIWRDSDRPREIQRCIWCSPLHVHWSDLFVDGHMVKVALTLKLHTDGLTEIGAAQDSQMIRKLRFSLEHQVI